MAKKFKIAALPKAQKGATASDSLFIYNNALQQKAYYDKLKPYYREPEIFPWSYTDAYIKEKEERHLRHPEPISWTAQEKAKFNKLKTQIKNNPDPNKSYILDIITGALDPNAPPLAYDRRITPQGSIYYNPKLYTTNMSHYMRASTSKSDRDYFVKTAKLSKDEIAIFDEIRKTKNNKLANIYDTYGQLTTPEEKNQLYKWVKSRGLSENAMKSLIYKKGLESKQAEALRGFSTELPYYDPIAVKPANMLTDAEFKKRYNKYGPSGLPQSRITKLGLKSNTTTNTATNKPNNKTVPKKEEKEELVLKTKPLELLPVNRETPTIIPSNNTYNIGKDNTIVPPQSVKQWKQNPATGTWYQIERPVNPMYSPKYNPGTGSYQKGGSNELIVNDPNDPRLKAYKDSLSLYNRYPMPNKWDPAIGRYWRYDDMGERGLTKSIDYWAKQHAKAFNLGSKILPIGNNPYQSTSAKQLGHIPHFNIIYHNPVFKKPVRKVTLDTTPRLKTKPVEQLPNNLEPLEIIPQTQKHTLDKGKKITLPQSVEVWKTLPGTNTPYRVDRPVDPRFSPKYNPGTGSYQGGGEKNEYIEIDADDTEIGDLIAQGYVVEELPKAQFGKSQQGFINVSPFSYHGDTPGMYRFDTQNPTFNVGYTQPFGSRAVNKFGTDALSASLTAKLPYQNNTGVGIEGNIHSDFNEWHDFPARMESDLSGGYDPKIGGYGSLIVSPQFPFGNVPQTVARKYGTGLKAGQFIGSVGPFSGTVFTPSRERKEEKGSIPLGVKGNIDFGLGRKGVKAGLSGYAGSDLFGMGLEENKEKMDQLKARYNWGVQANLKIPINPAKDYVRDLIAQKKRDTPDLDYTPKLQYGGLSQAQKGGEYYTYPGSEGVYRKAGNKWEVDWNRSGNFQPLSKGDIKEREAALNKGAKQLYDKDYSDMISSKQQKFESAPKPAPAKKLTKTQTAQQKHFDKTFKAGKSRAEEIQDNANKYVEDARKFSKEHNLPFTKEMEDEIINNTWYREGNVINTVVGAPKDPGVIRTPSKNTVYLDAPENPTFGDYAGKAWDIITNPIDYFNYSVATGDMMNAPWDITDYERVLEKTGAKDPILSRNAVGQALDFASYFNPITGTLQAIKTAAEIPGLVNRAQQTGDWSDAGLAIGETALEMIPGIGAIDDVAALAKKLPVQSAPYSGLSLRNIRMNEIVKGRNFSPFGETTSGILRAESPYDIGDVNLEFDSPAGKAYEQARLWALKTEGPPPPNIRTKPHRWKNIDSDDIKLSQFPKEQLDAFGLGQGEIPFSELKGERALTDPNYLENLKAARDRALKNGDEDLAKIYSDLIEKSKVTDLGRFTEAYTGSKAMKELGKERLNMFEPTPGEEYQMMLKDLDPTNTKKEVYQTISDAIEDTRANKVEKWKTAEGQKRLQNMIDTTPYLKELGMTPESYVNSLVNLENANKTYLEKLMDLDKINEKILNLDKQYDLGNIENQAYWNQIMDLESEILSKRDEIADIRGDINRSGKYNAFMEGTTKIGIGENINPFDLKQTIEHEISHLLQAGNKTSLDKELGKLKLIEDDEFGDIPGTYRVGEIGWLDYINSPEYIDEAKDYYRHGSEGKEKLAMVSELRQDLLDRGIIKDLYDKITPEMLQNHFDEYISKGTGKKSIPLRVYDIMEDDESNFKVLASVLNKLPMLIPAIGTGVAVGVGSQDTGTKPLGQAGEYQFKFGGSVGHKLSKFIG